MLVVLRPRRALQDLREALRCRQIAAVFKPRSEHGVRDHLELHHEIIYIDDHGYFCFGGGEVIAYMKWINPAADLICRRFEKAPPRVVRENSSYRVSPSQKGGRIR